MKRVSSGTSHHNPRCNVLNSLEVFDLVFRKTIQQRITIIEMDETKENLSLHICIILCINSGATVPKCWKQANVLPIFKKGDGSDFGNYRPVYSLIFAQKYVRNSLSNIYLISVEITTTLRYLYASVRFHPW